MMLNSSQQFLQQIPVLTSANLLALLDETNRFSVFDPLAEIRNGLNRRQADAFVNLVHHLF
jgi:hypothetical protein